MCTYSKLLITNLSVLTMFESFYIDADLFSIFYWYSIFGLLDMLLDQHARSKTGRFVFYVVLLVIFMVMKDHPIMKVRKPKYADEKITTHSHPMPRERKYIDILA